MSKKQLELSRRKVIAGLGTAGVAAAGAGLGTTAYLNDSESFENNIVTAGTLDLKIGYYSFWDQGSAGSDYVSGTADGEAVSGQLSDVKPGDSGIVAFCPVIESNPAYLWLCGELTANNGNGLTEPESAVDNSDGDGEGELAQSIQVTASYCDVQENCSNPEDISVTEEIWSGTFADFLALSQGGLPLDGDESAGVSDPGDQAPFDGTGDDGVDNPCLCLEWDVPTSVGNEIQGDSLSFDLQFFAEQSRHNDGTHNPCADETFTAPYINDSGSATQIEGTLRMDVNYGENSIAYRVQMDDDDSGAKMSTPLNSSTNVWIPFDTNDDNTMDFQLQWYPGAGLPSDPFGYKEHNGSWGSVQALPSGVTALKSGESIVFILPKSMIGASGDPYAVGAHMSAGGEAPYAAISTESSTGEIVPSGNFSSADYLIDTSVQ